MVATLMPETERLTLYDMHWKDYETLLTLLGDRPIRITYNQGIVELTTPTYHHERYKKILGRLLETLTEELNIPIAGGGSTTFRRPSLERGLEPDECFYIQNEPLVRGKRAIDLNQDPPPDLAIEIDITSSSINRMAIYAALGVPEVWRFDGETLTFHQRSGNEYQTVQISPTFSQVRSQDLLAFIQLAETTDDTTVIRQFRHWVKENLSPH
ncbi:Uma2 family endonuclease [Alkalinema pantanalense CENA528]|uniref:Uma2 family endonuclease n=1 Tax=Alkalinema pantanalense TaxID=1620705 RepID=UPI003D6DD786